MEKNASLEVANLTTQKSKLVSIIESIDQLIVYEKFNKNDKDELKKPFLALLSQIEGRISELNFLYDR